MLLLPPGNRLEVQGNARSPCSGHPTKHAAECPVIILARCSGAHNSPAVQDGGVRAGHPGVVARGGSRPYSSADGGSEGPQLRPDTRLPTSEPESGLVRLITGRMGHLRSGSGEQVPPVGPEGRADATTRKGGEGTRPAPTAPGSTEGPPPAVPRRRSPRQQRLQFLPRPRATPSDGHSAAPSRGSVCDSSPVNRDGGLHGNGSTSHGSSSPTQGGGRGAQASDQTGAFSGPHCGNQGQSAQARHPGVSQRCTSPLHHHGDGLVPLPGMESSSASPGDGHGQGSSHSQGDHSDSRRGDGSFSSGRRYASLPPNERVGSPDGGPSSHLDDRARASQSQSLSGVGTLGVPVRQRGDEASGSVIETRAARTISSGSENHAASQAGLPTDPNPVWQPVLFRSALKTLKLSNFSNECYANSSLLAALWTSSFCAAPEVSLRADLARDLTELLRHPTHAFHVWSRAPWRRLLRSWPHAGRQQDAADFLSYLQRQDALPLFSGHWITLLKGDTGGVCPVALLGDLSCVHGSRVGCTLQEVVDAWHSRAGSPALTPGTRCVALQQNRFRTDSAGSRKCSSSVSIPRQLSIPCWIAGGIQQILFQVSAVLIHLGDTPNSGHYRSALFEPNGRCWYTDDNRNAVCPSVSDAKVFRENAYVVFLSPTSTM